MKNDPHQLAFWAHPIQSIQQFLNDPDSLRTDRLQWTGVQPVQRAAFMHLLEIVRNRSLIDHLIQLHANRRPKPKLRAVLSLCVVQLLHAREDKAGQAKSIHHSVDIARTICSKQEANFVNAVARKICQSMDSILPTLQENSKKWHIYYSHPKWLVERWQQQYGHANTQAVLEWNQQIPNTYANDIYGVLNPRENKLLEDSPTPEELKLRATEWEDFWKLDRSDRDTVDQLLQYPFYIQDPSTRVAPQLFSKESAPKSILDACASPGGKSIHLFKQFTREGLLPSIWWATDLNDNRLRLVQENMERLKIPNIQTGIADWEDPSSSRFNNGHTFDWIIIDAPCTSVGVIQKHPEIRWRLKPEDYQAIPSRQLNILKSCSRLLNPGGQLVYSTCSFDHDENIAISRTFLDSEEGKGFELVKETTILPGARNHDGVGAFLLKRTS